MSANDSLARGLARRAVRSIDVEMRESLVRFSKLKWSTAKRPAQRLRQNEKNIKKGLADRFVGSVDINMQDTNIRVLFAWDTSIIAGDAKPRLMLGTIALSRETGDMVDLPLGLLVISEHAAARVIQRRKSLDWTLPMVELGDAMIIAWLMSLFHVDPEDPNKAARMECAIQTPHGSALIVMEFPGIEVTVVSWLPFDKLRPDQLIEFARFPLHQDVKLNSGETTAVIYQSWNINA